jgi:hypothetical protein
MVREFHQEAGAVVAGWELFAIIEGDTWRLFAYVHELDGTEWRAIRTLGKSVTDERVVKVPVSRVLANKDGAFYADVPALLSLALAWELWRYRAVHIDRRSL